MSKVTIVCSVYIAKGDYARIRKTKEWYNGITKSAGMDFNLSLVDDHSELGIEDLKGALEPKGYCKKITWERRAKKRQGKAINLNKLIKAVKTPFVAVVDNDVLLPDTWLVGCTLISGFGADPEISVSLEDRASLGSGKMTPAKIGVCGVAMERQIRFEKEHTIKGVPLVVPSMLGGACLVWRKDVLGDSGYFNEDFGMYGNEDNEFLLRLNSEKFMVVAILGRGVHVEYPDDDKEYIDWKRTTHREHVEDSDAILGKHYEKLGYPTPNLIVRAR